MFWRRLPKATSERPKCTFGEKSAICVTLIALSDNSADFQPRKHDESRLAVPLEHTVVTVRMARQDVPPVLLYLA
jgi:hypothetical protein